MERRVAGLGTVNAGGDPCRGQQLAVQCLVFLF